MKLTTRSILLFPCILFWCFSHAQNTSLYSFQDLSKTYYNKQKDSLKKLWDCPIAFKDKEAQKKYKEFWDSRTEFITSAIADDNFVFDADIVGYVRKIVQEIKAANTQSGSSMPLVLIDRNPAINAYAIGGDIVIVNLGLIAFSKSREELAMTLAHELSHNFLKHSENAMLQRAQFLTSDEYKQSLESVLNSKYERLTRLNKILVNYSFSRSRHQRYHEEDADSLAIVLLKKTNIPFSADFFLHLDSADAQYKQRLTKPVREYFTSYGLPFNDDWTKKRSKGLSGRNYNFNDTTNLQDSLRTHPECLERYKRTQVYSDPNFKANPIPAVIRDKVSKMLIWNMFANVSLTPCLYRILQEKDKGNTDVWYDFMLHNVFSAILYADKELKRFNAIGIIPKEYISKDYYEMQTMLEQIPTDQLQLYCKNFYSSGYWKKLPAAEQSFLLFMNVLSQNDEQSDKNISRSAREFVDRHPTSLYREFVGHVTRN